MIEAHDVTVRYSDVVILDGVSIEVGAGEWVALIGPNGAGKSTFIKAIADTVPFEGSVALDHAPLDTMSRREIALSLAVVPQNPVTPETMSVVDYVLLGRTPHLGYLAAETNEDVAIAEAALWDLGAIHLADRPLGSLSGGERQRCVLARALAQQCPNLILDEPESALDIGHRQQVLDLVEGLRRTRSISVLAAMHDLTLAAQYADRLVLLISGRIEASGRPDEVLTAQNISRFSGARVEIVVGPGGETVIVPRRS